MLTHKIFLVSDTHYSAVFPENHFKKKKKTAETSENILKTAEFISATGNFGVKRNYIVSFSIVESDKREPRPHE